MYGRIQITLKFTKTPPKKSVASVRLRHSANGESVSWESDIGPVGELTRTAGELVAALDRKAQAKNRGAKR